MSNLKAELTLLEAASNSAALSSGAALGASLTLHPGTSTTLESTASLSADLDVSYRVHATLPGPDLAVSSDLGWDGGSALTATLEKLVVSPIKLISPKAGSTPTSPGEWQTFEIKIPGKDLMASVRGALETLLVYLEVVKAVLETIKVFVVDFGNPIKALVEADRKSVV